jgi:WD40 repeat protein
LTVSGASSSFGSALSVSGDGTFIAVGSREDDAAYVFNAFEGTRLFTMDLDGVTGYYGYSVALSGDGSVLAVGYNRYYGLLDYEGRVYTYRTTGSWKDTPASAEIAAPETTYDSGFGSSLALSGDGNTLVVGAPQYRATYWNVGVVYAFEYNEGTSTWSSPTPVVGPAEGGSYFGTAVDVSSSGDLILVGAPGPETGEAWLFSWNGSTATRVGAVIKAPVPQNYEHFGKVVALSPDGLHALIGSPEHDDPVKGLDTGVAYLYSIGSDAWSYVDSFADPWGEANGSFGGSVCIGSGSSPIVVASSPGIAVDGNANAGAVFVF